MLFTKDIDEYSSVPTTHQQTVLTKIAVCAHQNDERCKRDIGKEAIAPYYLIMKFQYCIRCAR